MKVLAVNRSMRSASRNQFLRTPWAKEGDTYWFYKETYRGKNVYQLSKRKRKGASEVTVKRQKHGGFLFIKTYGLVDEEGIFITYKEDGENVIRFRLANKEESGDAQKWERRTPGKVYVTPTGGFVLNLPKEVRAVLKQHMCWRVEMHGGEKLYLSYSPIAESEYNRGLSLFNIGCRLSIPFEDFRQATYYEWHYKRFNKSQFSEIQLPTDFVRRCDCIKDGKSLLVYADGKGGFIVEAEPMVCECCGKPIKRFADNAYKIKVQIAGAAELAKELKECEMLLKEMTELT